MGSRHDPHYHVRCGREQDDVLESVSGISCAGPIKCRYGSVKGGGGGEVKRRWEREFP